MPNWDFPPIDSADEDGLLAVGGDLEVETLISAYQQGIFPWPVSKEYPLTWFSPNPRGVLYLKDFHISKSLLKFQKNSKFEIKFNTDFDRIIKNCSKAIRKDQSGTWIHQEILDAYISLFEAKKAYCVGVYLNGFLVGGLYGVCLGNFISGESMFHTETNASKIALIALYEKLIDTSVNWIDTQMVTPILSSFGAKELDRSEFKNLIKECDFSIRRDSIFSN